MHAGRASATRATTTTTTTTAARTASQEAEHRSVHNAPIFFRKETSRSLACKTKHKRTQTHTNTNTGGYDSKHTACELRMLQRCAENQKEAGKVWAHLDQGKVEPNSKGRTALLGYARAHKLAALLQRQETRDGAEGKKQRSHTNVSVSSPVHMAQTPCACVLPQRSVRLTCLFCSTVCSSLWFCFSMRMVSADVTHPLGCSQRQAKGTEKAKCTKTAAQRDNMCECKCVCV